MYTYHSRSRRILDYLSRSRPTAVAQLRSTDEFPGVCGTLMLCQYGSSCFAVVSAGGLSSSTEALRLEIDGADIHMPTVLPDGEDIWCAFLSSGLDACAVLNRDVRLIIGDGTAAEGVIHKNVGFYG